MRVLSLPEAEHEILEGVEAELGHGGREARREEGGQGGRAGGDLGDDALRETGHRELKSRTSRLVMVIRIDQ